MLLYNCRRGQEPRNGKGANKMIVTMDGKKMEELTERVREGVKAARGNAQRLYIVEKWIEESYATFNILSIGAALSLQDAFNDELVKTRGYEAWKRYLVWRDKKDKLIKNSIRV